MPQDLKYLPAPLKVKFLQLPSPAQASIDLQGKQWLTADRQNQSEEAVQLFDCCSSPSCRHAYLCGRCQHASVQAGPILLPFLPPATYAAAS